MHLFALIRPIHASIIHTMPYFNHAGHRLFYQTEGQGAPIVLHHGFTSSSAAWQYFGFVAALKKHYQVITFDALGHGKSDKPHDIAAYTLDQRCGAVLTLLDTLHIDQAHYTGFSLGGWAGYGLVQRAPERLASVIIGGAHPNADTSWDVFTGIDGQDADAFIRAFETVLNEAINPQMRMVIKANDLVALACAAQQRRLSLADALPELTMPALLFCGDQDLRHAAVKETAAHLPNAQFVSLPGVTHLGGVMHPQLLLPAVEKFLAAQIKPA